MTVTFDPERHEYSVDGRKLPHVTKILAEMGLRKTGFWEQGIHRLRGTRIHEGCRYVDEAVWTAEGTHPQILPCILAYQRFCQRHGFRAELNEERVVSLKYSVAGTLDKWGRAANGERWLVDLKHGNRSNQPAAWLQTALYELMLLETRGSEFGCDARIILFLGDDATPREERRNGAHDDRQRAIEAVNLWWFKANHGLLEERK